MTCPSCGAAFHAFYKVSKVVDQMLAGMIAVEDAGGAKARLRWAGEEYSTFDELVSMNGFLKAALGRMHHYHGHVLRARWQGGFIKRVHAKLPAGIVVLTVDYMMKAPVVKFMEAVKGWWHKETNLQC